MKEEKILRKVLRDNHSRITKPRLAVFRLLLKHSPLSHVALIEQSKGEIDRVSVYRVIDLFERLGIVRRATIGWKHTFELSEIFLDHHHHIICVSCKRVFAIEEDQDIERSIIELAYRAGFTVSSHQLELQGYCLKCQKTPRSPK